MIQDILEEPAKAEEDPNDKKIYNDSIVKSKYQTNMKNPSMVTC